jgi:hypothetical protein
MGHQESQANTIYSPGFCFYSLSHASPKRGRSTGLPKEGCQYALLLAVWHSGRIILIFWRKLPEAAFQSLP